MYYSLNLDKFSLYGRFLYVGLTQSFWFGVDVLMLLTRDRGRLRACGVRSHCAHFTPGIRALAWRFFGLRDSLFGLSRMVMVVPLFLLSSCFQDFPFPPPFACILPRRRSLSFGPLGREDYIVRDTREWHAVYFMDLLVVDTRCGMIS